jgi:hypothetical protein
MFYPGNVIVAPKNSTQNHKQFFLNGQVHILQKVYTKSNFQANGITLKSYQFFALALVLYD